MSSRKNIFTTTQGNFLILFFTTAVIFIFCGGVARAATLGASPANQTVSAGNTLIVRVVVDSQGQSINAVSGGVTFSNDLLTLTGISKNNSIVSLWAQDPSYSNASGTASFQGVILNGFAGTGTVLTLAFKAKAIGTATVGLSTGSSSVLLNDGQGTNVLSGTGSDTITIGPAQITPPAHPIVPAVAPSTAPTVPTIPKPLVPVINEYQKTLLSNNYAVARGTADPNSILTVTLSNGSDTIIQSSLTADANGTFTYVSDNKLAGGTYVLGIRTSDGRTAAPITIIVRNSLSFVTINWLTALISIRITLIWVVLLIALSLYLWHRNRIVRRHLKEVIEKIHTLEQK